ncbi:MAG: hypothetical protein Q9223_003731 [Gallowayella weberi]
MISTSCQPTSKPKPFNRAILLYGPPGTGKSTLCRSLVQKLAIRLKSHYATFQMIEIDAAALFSKFFGESSKLVSRIFDTIECMLKQQPKVFVCVLLDEIESLAGARQQSIGGNEPKDSMRALNALLVALDRLNKYSNVLILCTSNLVQTIDTAVLDRINVKQYVPEPGVKIRYEILRRCYQDLLDIGMISPPKDSQAEEDFPSSPTTILSFEDEELAPQPGKALPRYEIMQLDYQTKENSVPYKLWKIAEKSAVGPSIFCPNITELKRAGTQRTTIAVLTHAGSGDAYQLPSMLD